MRNVRRLIGAVLLSFTAGAQEPRPKPLPSAEPALVAVPGGVLGGVPGGVPGGVLAGVPGLGPDGAFEARFAKFGSMFLAQAKARGSRDEDAQYSRGQRALDNRKYDEALQWFSEAAAQGGSRADGALYWKAYTEHKLGRRDDALATLARLRKEHASSRWLDDAKALEAEVRQAQGQPPTPESETDEEIKLIAINSLMHSDPESAAPLLEKVLQGSRSPKLKERALFVLMQSGSPRAREVVVQIARGKGNPDLQLKAVQYLGMMKSNKELGEIYAATNDVDIKRAVLRGFMMSGARDELLQAAKSEKLPDLRREAIRQLSVTGAQNELWKLYQAETDTDVKKELVRGFSVSGSAERLLELAKSEKDANLRREAVRGLGNMGAKRTGEALVAMYGGESDKSIRKEIARALRVQDNAKALVELARKETDPDLKKDIVSSLSHMRSKEATDYLMEILNK